MHLSLEAFANVLERVKQGIGVEFEHLESLVEEVIFHRSTLVDDPSPMDTFLRWFSNQPLEDQTKMASFLSLSMAPLVQPTTTVAPPPQPIEAGEDGGEKAENSDAVPSDPSLVPASDEPAA